jgi:RNA polymerase sigma-70 factor (ECF subfamily)
MGMKTAIARSAPVDPRIGDADLAALVAARDETAIRFLMRRHNRMLYRTARSILKDDAEAEDALQEAYMKAIRAMETFRGDAKLSTWLVRIVANEALARLRKTRRGAEVIALGEDVEAAQDREENMETSNDNEPEREALRAEARRIIEKRIDELPENFRSVFMLRAVEEMSVEEVAAALDIPEATVRSRLFRARALMRTALSHDLDAAMEGAFSFDGARCDRIVENVVARLAAAEGFA